MKLKNKKRKFNVKENRGITLVDVTIAAIFVAVFTGTIASIMYKSYNMAIDIQDTSAANAYATIIMEKVDEKSFEEVSEINQPFLTTISNELDYDSSKYKIEYKVDEETTQLYEDLQEEYKSIFKKVTVTVSYAEGTKKEGKVIISLSKLKVKEMGNE